MGCASGGSEPDASGESGNGPDAIGDATCAASLSPTSGTTSTEFYATWSSDGTSCSWALDGVNQGSIECSGSDVSIGTLGAGTHRITLTATGPGGTVSCDSNTVTVTVEGEAPPTCAASLSPTSGTTSTEFYATWSSDGTSCSWALDGVDQGSIECSGSNVSIGTLGAGTHRVTLTATGPGGTTSCNSNTVNVSP